MPVIESEAVRSAADLERSGWRAEKHLGGVLGESRNDLRDWRQEHLKAGTDWVTDEGRVIWWSPSAIERKAKGAAVVVEPVTAVKCRVVRGWSLPNKRLIEVLVMAGMFAQRRVTVRVRENGNFGPPLEVLACPVPGTEGRGVWEFRGRPEDEGRVVRYPRGRGRW